MVDSGIRNQRPAPHPRLPFARHRSCSLARPPPWPDYRIRNGKHDNDALVRADSIILYFDQAAIREWRCQGSARCS